MREKTTRKVSASEILASASEVLRPPRRLSVSQAASQYMKIHRPGGYSGPWRGDQTPYMVEPMDRLADRTVEAVVFVGPARTGKSAALILGWLTHAVCCDPGDFMIIHMTADTARDFSRDEVARLHRYSPDIKERLSPFSRDDNVYDKQYRHGMMLKLAWPSITQLSGKTLRYVALTDYDRFPTDVDGEGDAFTLGRKRIQTFLSSGKILVESSPGHMINEPKWAPVNQHEAPPCQGIFGIYQQGDRRRWYWPCLECGEYFTAIAGPEAFVEVNGEAKLACPHCGVLMDRTAKPELNRRGVWLADGQTISRDGTISGFPKKTGIASYWLTGPAAAYQSWDSLLQKYKAAHEEMERTGSEEGLQAVITGDFGTAYRPRQAGVVRDPRVLAERAEDWQKREVPPGVKYLTAAVDVQGNRFVVQVIGWGIEGERWLIDRYNLRWSTRKNSADDPEPIDPAKYVEDWQLIIRKVVNNGYPLSWNNEKELRPLVTAVDSGGKAGVTERAYHFWKQCRASGLGGSVILVKGISKNDAPRLKKTYPDSTRRADRHANARGEVPVYQINTLVMKDSVSADLARSESGPGYVHIPAWVGAWFFDELTAEVRTAKGWESHGGRNEAFDLMVYNAAGNIYLGGDKIDWKHPPLWADPDKSSRQSTSEYAIAPRPVSAMPKPKVKHDGWGL